MSNEYLHIFLNLLGVVALMVVLLLLMKKVKTSKFATNKQIKIINAVSIGSKEKIILVEVNQAMLLLGATPNHIETLYVFNEQEAPSALGKEASSEEFSFSEQLSTLQN